MTKAEIKKEIARIEDLRWYLSMKDPWNNEDREQDQEYREQLRVLTEKLNG